VNDYGDIDLGACVWCKARLVGCSTVQRRGCVGASKAKVKDAVEPKEIKRKASEVDSEESEEEPLAKKFKLNSIIEDSEEEEWEGIQDKGDWPKDSGEERETEEVREEVEEVRVSSVSETEGQEKTEEDKEKDKSEAKRARKEGEEVGEEGEEVGEEVREVRRDKGLDPCGDRLGEEGG
jgi:hypothetical protein